MRHHLKNVYASLMMCLMSAGAGAYVHLFTGFLQVQLSTAQCGEAVVEVEVLFALSLVLTRFTV